MRRFLIALAVLSSLAAGTAHASSLPSVSLAGAQTPPNPGNTKDCSDFPDWPTAQSWFERYEPFYGDVAGLDANRDGEACESLPGGPLDAPAANPAGAAGYWMLSANGTVYGYGSSRPISPRIRVAAGTSATSMAPAGTSGGYYVLQSDGTVYARGATDRGGAAGQLLPGERATSISVRPQNDGYWIFTDRGRVFTFGAAPRASTLGGDLSSLTLNGPVVASVPAANGNGYWMVGSDGGVFSFDVPFYGSMGGQRLNEPVNGIVPDPDGVGYWLVASDGGIFSFEATFRGSIPGVLQPGQQLNAPVVGALANGNGYLMVASDGGIFNFSDQPFLGSLGSQPPLSPVVGVAVRPR